MGERFGWGMSICGVEGSRGCNEDMIGMTGMSCHYLLYLYSSTGICHQVTRNDPSGGGTRE